MNCLKCKKDLKYGGGKKGVGYQSLHTTEKKNTWNFTVYFCNDCINNIIKQYNT